ncbi:MAG TPA: transposase, partial [Candidatus Caenarcaniphilales bacterium]|nr:transposase [Candidatus Caenarcaniphilales bacterium]
PEAVVLVAADGAEGIAAAVAEAFPEAALQRCWTHRIRLILEALPLAERRSCLAWAAGDLSRPHEASGGRRLLALGEGVARPPPDHRAQPGA